MVDAVVDGTVVTRGVAGGGDELAPPQAEKLRMMTASIPIVRRPPRFTSPL